MYNLGEIINQIRKLYNIDIIVKFTHPSRFISDGYYNVLKQHIVLNISIEDYRNNTYFLICILLHELGHHIDYLKHNCDFISFYKVNKYECEEQAWMYAKSISKQLGVEITEEFNAVMNYALSSYNNTSRHDLWRGWSSIKKLYLE